MSEAEFQSILEQLERSGHTQDKLKIDVVTRLNRLKKGSGLEIATEEKNSDGDESLVGSTAAVVQASPIQS